MTALADAEETLGAMLAEAGMDPDVLDPWEAWKVFKRFLRVPMAAQAEKASFQCGIDRSDEPEPRFYMEIFRQFDEPAGKSTLPVGAVGLEFNFDPDTFPVAEEREIWGEAGRLDVFIAAVEASPEFQAAMNARPVATGVWVERA